MYRIVIDATVQDRETAEDIMSAARTIVEDLPGVGQTIGVHKWPDGTEAVKRGPTEKL